MKNRLAHLVSRLETEVVFSVKLWDTIIVTVHNNVLTLNHGGFNTPTTAKRMDETMDALGLPLRIARRKGIFHVFNYVTKEITPFNGETFMIRLDKIKVVA